MHFVLSLAVTSPHLHASIVIISVITFAGGTTQPPLIRLDAQNSEVWNIKTFLHFLKTS